MEFLLGFISLLITAATFLGIPYMVYGNWKQAVKSFADFCAYIVKNGLPTAICFDHDLGVKYPSNAKELVANGGKFVELTSGTYIEGTVEYPTGMDCAKFLVDYCLDTEQELPLFASQSANPSGRENILGLLNNFKKFQDENRMEK